VYNANFVDRVLVLDPYNESEEFKALGEEELLLPIDVKHIGLSEAVCMLTIQESYKK
jgi:hypothetical protein